jgi:hypothetical protein
MKISDKNYCFISTNVFLALYFYYFVSQDCLYYSRENFQRLGKKHK